jgi:uncharacterized protein YdaU (DUF1376 family)
MIRLNWYKRYPKDFREGTRKLTFEERGFYGDVLDLIYEHGNDLLDDDEENAHMLRCSARVFRRLKARLVELGKLFVEGGRLRNGRADAEANAASIRIQTAREHAKLGGLSPKNRKGEPGDFNDMPEAGGQAPAEAPSREALKASRLLGETESLPAAAESTTRAPAYEAARPTAPPRRPLRGRQQQPASALFQGNNGKGQVRFPHGPERPSGAAAGRPGRRGADGLRGPQRPPPPPRSPHRGLARLRQGRHPPGTPQA